MTSKLCPHNLIPNSATRPWFEAGAIGVKCVNDFGSGMDALAVRADALVIGRKKSMYPDDPNREITAENLYQAHESAPDVAANFFVDVQAETYRLNPFIKYWEGPNEPVWESEGDPLADILARYRWYGLFEKARVERLGRMGLRAVILNFSSGKPHLDDTTLNRWQALQPAIDAIKAQGGLAGLHEYGDWNFTPANLNARGEGDNLFRYRMVNRLILKGQVGVVLTEYGMNNFRNHLGTDYADWLSRCDAELQKDNYLKSAFVFTCGSNNPQWDSFDVSREPAQQARIVSYIRQQATAPVTPPPVITPPVIVPPPIPTTANLLTNSDLFTGGFSIYPGHLSTNVPNGWTFNAEEGIGPSFPDSPPATPWGVPSAVYHSIDGRPGTTPLPASEHALYFNAANPAVWHLSLRYGKMWWKLSQTLKDVPPGFYKLQGEIYPDIYTGNHVWATDPACGQWIIRSGSLRIGGGNGGFGHWNELGLTFSHFGGDLTLTLEAVAPFGVEVVGWFVRGLSLTRMDTPMQLSNTGPATVIDKRVDGSVVKILNMREFGSLEAPVIEELPALSPVLLTGKVMDSDANKIVWVEIRSVKHGAGWCSLAFLRHD